MTGLLSNAHCDLPFPGGVKSEDVYLVQGDYLYYHYRCDNIDDRGWGCGYRTLQTLMSWVRHRKLAEGNTNPPAVLTIRDIQKLLVEIGDKPAGFVGSRDWIGSVEVALVIDSLFDVQCKLVHIVSGDQIPKHFEDLCDHFTKKGAPIMMGGDGDAASKAIIGVCRGETTNYALILDPHYHGPKPDQTRLIDSGMLLWRPMDSFMDQSFYNLCLPQYNLTYNHSDPDDG